MLLHSDALGVKGACYNVAFYCLLGVFRQEPQGGNFTPAPLLVSYKANLWEVKVKVQGQKQRTENEIWCNLRPQK